MQVLQIQVSEAISIDEHQLGALRSQLGNSGAEDVICRAMEELALRISRCSDLFQAGEEAALRKNARSLISIAEQIGMYTLSKVAEDVTNCIDCKDQTAIAATLSRLIRTAETSLNQVYEHQTFHL